MWHQSRYFVFVAFAEHLGSAPYNFSMLLSILGVQNLGRLLWADNSLDIWLPLERFETISIFRPLVAHQQRRAIHRFPSVWNM